MIISKIVFENFKVYEGRQSLNCEINDMNKPLILIGGKTGAGKTSIIEGVKLCLYGNESKNLWKNHSSYNQYISTIHNKNAKLNRKNNISIQLTLKINEIGRESILLIERKWTLKNKLYNEKLFITRDGESIQFIEKGYWQEYINKLIPIGLADFMFFNSEEFSSIPNHLENGFVDSLLKYFGIDTYKQLNIDLGRHQTHIGSKYNKKLSKEIEDFETELPKFEELISNQKSTISKLETYLIELEESKKTKEKELKKKATIFAKTQEQLIHEKGRLSAIIKKTNDEYDKIAGELLPFSLAPDLIEKFKNKLLVEREIKNNIVISEEYGKLKTRLKELLKGRVKNLSQIIIELDTTNTLNTNSKEIKHDFTSSETESINDILTNSIENAKKLLVSNRATFRHLLSDQQKNSSILSKINPEGPSKEIYNKLGEINNLIGKIIERKDIQIRDLKPMQKRVDYLQTKINAGQNKLAMQAISNKKVSLIYKSRMIINEYYNYLIDKRFKEFRNHFHNVLENLTVKGDLVHSIELDREHNKIQFYDNNNELISMNHFSAGESEIIGLAIILAVFSTENNNYPIITDSPLNRLDGEHRKKVIELIIKDSTRQVIFLSTDEEISNTKVYGLNSYITANRYIKYDDKIKASRFENEYFK